MNILPKPILTKDLNVTDVPKEINSWDEIIEFASTFQMELDYPEQTGVKLLSDLKENSSIQEMRVALYNEWRRFNHYGRLPDEQIYEEAKNTIAKIKMKIEQ